MEHEPKSPSITLHFPETQGDEEFEFYGIKFKSSRFLPPDFSVVTVGDEVVNIIKHKD